MDMSSNIAFEYKSLSRDLSEIRLLQILSAKSWDDTIEIVLSHAYLSQHPKYAALSYSWGKPSSSYPTEWDDPRSLIPVTVNGQSFAVRYNLHLALQQFRSSYPVNISWWIDAICIDQSCIPERNHQVACMTQIYSSCTYLVIWLGPSHANTHEAFQAMRKYAQYRRESARNAELAASTRKHEWSLDNPWEVFQEENARNYLLSLQDLMSRSWWQRSWVIREICVAPTGRVFVQCGEHCELWPALFALCRRMEMLSERFMSYSAKKPGRKLFKQCELFEDIYWSFVNIYFPGKLMEEAQTKGRRPSLLQLLSCARKTCSTDPRDKLYSLIGLSDAREIIKVDYSLSAQETFTKFAARHIETAQSFRILGECKYPPLLANLPSWVPDWSDHGPVPETNMTRYISRNESLIGGPMLYSATASSNVYFRFEERHQVLILRGGDFDAISYVSSPVDTRPSGPSPYWKEISGDNELQDISLLAETVQEGLRDWANWVSHNENKQSLIDYQDWVYFPEASSDQFHQLRYPFTDDSVFAAYHKTFMADRMDSEDSRRRRLRSGNPPSETNGEELSATVRRSFLNVSWNVSKAFAVTGGGLFTLVPPQTRAGDVVAFVQGSDVPFVLRPQGNEYLFIGECYAHGAMDGEAWAILQETNWIRELRII